MIFAVYPRVVVKLGDERYEFDRASLMFPEVVEIETVSGMSYGEWEAQLCRYSVRAVAALLHVLRRRAGVASNFAATNFAMGDLDVVPLHEDGSEFAAAEVADDIVKRLTGAEPDPTSGTAVPAGPAPPQTQVTSGTSLASPASTTSAPGNGNGSPGVTSRSSKRTPTRA